LWLDGSSEPIKNEIIEGDLLEPVYIVTKKSETGYSDSESVKAPSIVPGTPDNESVIPDIMSVIEETPAPAPAPAPAQESKIPKGAVVKKEVQVVKEEVEVVEEEEVEVVKEEVVKEEVVKEEVVKEEVVEEEVVEEEVVEEEVVEEEEEEQGYEEIEFKGKRYCRDDEGFIYSIDEDDQPSENPIGVWKEKTQSIAFYKTK
jgi:hypothetical protein